MEKTTDFEMIFLTADINSHSTEYWIFWSRCQRRKTGNVFDVKWKVIFFSDFFGCEFFSIFFARQIVFIPAFAHQ